MRFVGWDGAAQRPGGGPLHLTSGKYRLVGRTVLPEPVLLEWARWMEKADRKVARDKVGRYTLSTVFLGSDHGFARYAGRREPPILFETAIFEDPKEELAEFPSYLAKVIASVFRIDPAALAGEVDIRRRYATWDEAEAGHWDELEDLLDRSRGDLPPWTLLAAAIRVTRRKLRLVARGEL